MQHNYIFIFNFHSTIKRNNFFWLQLQRNFRNPISKSKKAQDNFRNCGSYALQNKLRSAQLWSLVGAGMDLRTPFVANFADIPRS